MTPPPQEKSSLEKFLNTLDDGDKTLLSTYIADQSYENLSSAFDQILENHEIPKTDN